jgi:DNA polymerase III subunit delta'
MAESMRETAISGPLPWQLAQWQRLSAQLGQGRLHHALLFSGPSGVGKRLLAELLAAAVLCSAGAGGEICGVCRNCQLFRAGSHPDLLRIAPEPEKRQIRIHQVREQLTDFVMRTTSMAPAKVVIIDPADAMNLSTANCLLKTLEEPSPATHILLLTDAPARLLATIRSRCESVRLRPPAPADGLDWLRHVAGLSGAEDLLGAASGCPLGALRIEERGGLQRYQRIARMMNLASVAAVPVPVLAGECSDLELGDILADIFLFLVELSRALAIGVPQGARIAGACDAYAELLPRISALHLARSMQKLLAAQRDAASTANPNRQLLLEALLIDWQQGIAGWQNAR